MNKFFYILLCLSILPCSGCSSIGANQFLVPQENNIEEYVFQKDWSVDIYPEGSFGQFRPYLYKSKFNDKLSYTMYPVTIDERGWGFGPILLPVIPIWFLRAPSEHYKPGELRIIWFGSKEIAEEIVVTLKHLDKEDIGKLTIMSSTLTETDCSYAFKNILTEGDIIYLTLKMPFQELEIKLKGLEHICFVPYMNPLYGGGPNAKYSQIKYFQKEISNMNASLAKQKENEATKANHADSPNGETP